MSIIVVEGVDASGKSTLLENIRAIPKKYFVLMRHSCRPLKPADIIRFLNTIEENGLTIVADRHPLISEPIYGPLLRKENLVEKIFTTEQVNRRLSRTVDRIIYCRPPSSIIHSCLNNRPQLAGIKEKIDLLIDEYDKRMLELDSIVPVRRYDYTCSPSIPEFLDQLIFGARS